MKKWYESKTLWFNLLGLVVLVAGSFGYTGELPSDWQAIGFAIVAILNMVLRYFFTETPIA